MSALPAPDIWLPGHLVRASWRLSRHFKDEWAVSVPCPQGESVNVGAIYRDNYGHVHAHLAAAGPIASLGPEAIRINRSIGTLQCTLSLLYAKPNQVQVAIQHRASRSWLLGNISERAGTTYHDSSRLFESAGLASADAHKSIMDIWYAVADAGEH